jgi:hypothetical protein
VALDREGDPRDRRHALTDRARARHTTGMRFVVLALIVPLAACPDRTVAKLEPQPSGQVEKVIPTSTDIDILFVIDDSLSTKDKQDVFASNFTNFVQALDGFPGGRPNVHIGVVSTTVDIGPHTIDWGPGCAHPSPLDGRLQNAPRVTGCTPPNGKWIEDVATSGGARQTNYTGPLDQTLACIAELGSGGCGFEAPLQAVERALDGSHAENAGFLRPGAFLAVIILTDEDDASAKDDSLFALDPATYGMTDFRAQPMFAYTCDQPIVATGPGQYTNCHTRTDSYLQTPQYYAAFLSSLKAPGQVVVAVLGGPPTKDIATGAITNPIQQDLALLKSCDATINGTYAIGRPGIRLNDFVQAFGDHGLYDTICQPDYSKTLEEIGQVLLRSISPCLGAGVDPTDIDPGPGLQLDCTVSDVTGLGTASRQETVIARCPMVDATHPEASPRPCWWVEQDTISCPSPSSGLALHVQRDGDPPPGDDIDVKCALK